MSLFDKFSTAKQNRAGNLEAFNDCSEREWRQSFKAPTEDGEPEITRSEIVCPKFPEGSYTENYVDIGDSIAHLPQEQTTLSMQLGCLACTQNAIDQSSPE